MAKPVETKTSEVFSMGPRNGLVRALRAVAVLLTVLVTAFPWAMVAYAASNAGEREKWEQVKAAAEKEGRVSVAHGGTASPEVAAAIKDGFRKKFPNIEIEFVVAGGRSIAPRILMERRAGRYLWDVYMGGTTTALTYLVPASILDPIQSVLVLPEVTRGENWLGGELDFADDAKRYDLVFGGIIQPTAVINSKLVQKDKIQSLMDFLDPKWKGKIVMFDPRGAGVGLATVVFWYTTPGLGKDYIRRFFTEQEVKLSRDPRQQLEWVARGDYSIAIGVNLGFYDNLKKEGLPVELLNADDLKEGSYLTSGIASMGLVNRAPHPNAAAVYINWLLSKDGQTIWSRATQYPSRRVDVPTDHLNATTVPRSEKLSSYQQNYKEKIVNMRGEIVAFLRTVIK